MTYKYYDSEDSVSMDYLIGDISINILSRKEKYPGLIVRKMSVTGLNYKDRNVTII